jgi:predicted PurR-regulated permease PerM
VAASNLSQQKSLVRYTLGMTVLAVVVVYAAYRVRNVLLLLYVSGLLAIGFSPIIRLIEKQRLLPVGEKRFPRWLAILVLYLFVIGTLVGIGMLIFPPLYEQGRAFVDAAPQMFDRAQDFLIQRGILREHIGWREAVEKAPVGEGGGGAVNTVFGAIMGVLGGIFGFLTVLILTFYILVDADNLRNGLLHLFSRDDRPRVAAASKEIVGKVSAWLGGQLLLAAIIGATSAIGLYLLGIPFFYVLALISAIGEMIPIVGPFLAAIPAVAVAASVSPQKVLLVIIFFIVQQQIENHVLVPKVMERQVGVSAVTVVVALLIGGNLLGIVGAILAVPTAAILQVVFTEVTKQKNIV